MKSVSIIVNKTEVYNEVAKTTAYTGKKAEAEGSYARALATKSDGIMLDRFWNEAQTLLCGALKRHIVSESDGDTYTINLGLPDRYDDAITPSLNKSAFMFFALLICSKWFGLYDQVERDRYATEAIGYLEDVRKKVLHRKRPIRPTYKNE